MDEAIMRLGEVAEEVSKFEGVRAAVRWVDLWLMDRAAIGVVVEVSWAVMVFLVLLSVVEGLVWVAGGARRRARFGNTVDLYVISGKEKFTETLGFYKDTLGYTSAGGDRATILEKASHCLILQDRGTLTTAHPLLTPHIPKGFAKLRYHQTDDVAAVEKVLSDGEQGTLIVPATESGELWYKDPCGVVVGVIQE